LNVAPTYPQGKLTFALDDYGKKGSITPTSPGADFLTIGWRYLLETFLVSNNIRYLSYGCEKSIRSLKIQPYRFFTTTYVYKLYFHTFTKEPAFLLNSTDIQSGDTIFQTIYFRQKHQIEGKPWLNDQSIRSNGHEETVMRSTQLGENVCIGMTGCPALVEQAVFRFGR
jgi:hypothetical protein